MATYHCPHCNALINHKPELAGDRVVCSKCKGEYFEPTDPLPGVKPQKAPPVELHQGGQVLALGSSPSMPANTSGGLQQVEPFDMVMEMKRRGNQALMITKSPAKPQDLSVVFSDNLTQDQVNDTILKLAVRIMQTKWPDVYQLVAKRV